MMYGKLEPWIVRFLFALISLPLLISTGAAQDGATQMLRRGKQEYAAGNYMGAEGFFRAAVHSAGENRSDSEQTSALADLGAVLLVQGRAAESEPFLQRALENAQRSSDIAQAYA